MPALRPTQIPYGMDELCIREPDLNRETVQREHFIE